MDIFERSPLLITFNTTFKHKIGPIYALNGPTLEFSFGWRSKKLHIITKCVSRSEMYDS